MKEIYNETQKEFKARMHERRIKESKKDSYRLRNNIKGSEDAKLVK